MTQQHSPEQDASEHEQVEGRAKGSSIREKLNAFWWKVHARFPSLVPNPYRDEQAFLESDDINENAASRLPPDHDVALASIWVCEVFGPSEIETFYHNLGKLGWDEKLSRQSATEWIKRQRSYGSEGFMEMGSVLRPGERKLHMPLHLTAEFPQEFDSLIVNVIQITSSLTCLMVGFILSKTSSTEYARVLNQEFATRKKRISRDGAISILSVDQQKMDAMKNCQDRLRHASVEWMNKSFPGFFAKLVDKDRVPTGDLILTRGYTAYDLSQPYASNYYHWGRYLNIDQAHEAWLDDKSGLRFAFARNGRGPANHVRFALRLDKEVRDEGEPTAAHDPRSASYFAHKRIRGIFARHAAICFVREARRSLTEMRERLHGLKQKGDRGLSILNDIEAFFASMIGMPSIARELSKLSANDSQYSSTGFTLQSLSKRDPRIKTDLSGALVLRLRHSTTNLLHEDQDTRQYLEQYNAILGTTESVRAQRKMEYLTVFALVISVVSVAIAVLSLSHSNN
ncbi:hypothetical protein ACQZ6H_19800 [Agrobacterium fabrum]|uniref:hypothetical protein n=1 Tax=Agrobacterium fabrum TaxID=1176649 RepID=UPI001573032B|nr:hypothetical protein [Agrobacterium fabrum]WIE30873.1 hypothetical protein G6L42_022870 [Agrobacterium fabrum]WIE46820.1 hypothetical protein G6L76_022815 [Agrobacterium fabrum]